ncbi:MAG: hypothetical protein HN948_02490 [Clostridia bacterium]|jgi:hypothetical protein|nr:hypothetical protein [Clostridia bacterium]
MIETLLAYARLLEFNILTLEKYNEYLNDIFLENPDNDLLLDLQWCSSDIKTSIGTILTYSEMVEINYDLFGKMLFSELKLFYFKNQMDIQTFALKVRSIWWLLPNSIGQKEPFHAMSYLDEPLSWGDEKQTRELYEKMFEFYEINDTN